MLLRYGHTLAVHLGDVDHHRAYAVLHVMDNRFLQ